MNDRVQLASARPVGADWSEAGVILREQFLEALIAHDPLARTLRH